MQCFVQKQSFERTSIITKRGRIITKRGDLITEIIFTPLCSYNYTCSELRLLYIFQSKRAKNLSNIFFRSCVRNHCIRILLLGVEQVVNISLSDCFRSVRVFFLPNRLKSLQLGSCTLHSRVSRIDF